MSDIEFFISEDSLDFHYLDKFDPYEVEIKLGQFLEDSYIKKMHNVVVVVGKGEVVRPFVKKHLARNRLVEKFRSASDQNGGSGAFEVILKI